MNSLVRSIIFLVAIAAARSCAATFVIAACSQCAAVVAVVAAVLSSAVLPKDLVGGDDRTLSRV